MVIATWRTVLQCVMELSWNFSVPESGHPVVCVIFRFTLATIQILCICARIVFRELGDFVLVAIV